MSSSTREFDADGARKYNVEAREAAAMLESMGIPRGEDFFVLSSAQVCRLLEAADHMHYQKPNNANGSRGRYFHAFLQRRAARFMLTGQAEAVGCSLTTTYHSRRRKKR